VTDLLVAFFAPIVVVSAYLVGYWRGGEARMRIRRLHFPE
jgi:hypothetical protein